MAEPTIKDVLSTLKDVFSALSKMEARLDAKIDGVDGRLSRLDAKLGAVHIDLLERIEALDDKVEVLRGVLESTRRDTRDLRDDVTVIHKGLVRVVPKDLPSQVRAKERPSRPAKRAARRR